MELMNKYLELLMHSHLITGDHRDGMSTALEFLAGSIFDFTTYDSEMDELFARKAVEVCAAINDGTTFTYIRDKENYKWFLLMVNMPFFIDRLEWGTSIRSAWWDHKPHTLSSCGLWDGDAQLIEPIVFTREQWRDFIAAIIEFSAPPQAGADGAVGVAP